MALQRRRTLPDPMRRALRLAICVGVSVATGFALLEPLGGWKTTWGSQMMMGTKWAAVTSCVVTAPVIGQVTQVATERVLGTTLGGVLGYAALVLGETKPLVSVVGRPVYTTLTASTVAFLSVLAGSRLQLDYSGRLFIMTFILTVMGAPRVSDGFAVAVTRILGICFGVMLTILTSVVLFPKSASHQATDSLKRALEALAQLNTFAWNGKRGAASPKTPSDNGSRSPASGSCSDLYSPPRHSGDQDSCPEHRNEMRAPLLDEEQAKDESAEAGASSECEEALADVYRQLQNCEASTKVARGESYVTTIGGRWCFCPGIFWRPWRVALPEAAVTRFCGNMRRVARLLWILHTTLHEGQGYVRELVSVEEELDLPWDIQAGLQAFLQSLADTFPVKCSIDSGSLRFFVKSVDGFLARACSAHYHQQAGLRVVSHVVSPIPHVTSPVTPPRLPSAKSAPGVLLDEALGSLLEVATGAAKNGRCAQGHLGCRSSKSGLRFIDGLQLGVQQEMRKHEDFLSQMRRGSIQFTLRRLCTELQCLQAAYSDLISVMPPALQ